MRVLGVDPGLTRCGVGLVDGAVGSSMSMVLVDVVRSTPSDDLGRRLQIIYDHVCTLIETHRPDSVAVERVFSQLNTRTITGTAQAAGVVVLAAQQSDVPVEFYTPTEVKAAVTGSGNAAKPQVGAMVTRILRLSHTPKPADAADALALAITDVWRGQAKRRIRQALQESR